MATDGLVFLACFKMACWVASRANEFRSRSSYAGCQSFLFSPIFLDEAYQVLVRANYSKAQLLLDRIDG